jgi:cytochrome o ubiquinol oxidase subunit IV
MSGAHVSKHPAQDASHGSLKSLIAGFILSLGLTALSFGAVTAGAVPEAVILPAITFLAVVQLLVQLVFFLHLGTAPGQRNNTVIFLLTGLLIATIVAGSLWVMHNANINMMPTQMSPERARAKD